MNMVANSDNNSADAGKPTATERSDAESAPNENLGADFWRHPYFLRVRSFISKIIYRIDRILGDIIAVVLGLGILGLWYASAVLDQQTTDLTVFRPNIKTWFADSFDGRDAEFGRLELAWLPVDDHFVISIKDAVIRDQNGEVLEKFESIKSVLEPGQDLISKPRLVSARIKGGVLTYLEDRNGFITAGLGPPETVGRIGPVYRADNATKPQGDFNLALQGLEFVQIDDAQIYIKNAVSGINLASNIDNLTANFSDSGNVTVNAKGTVDQKYDVMPFTVSSVFDAGLEAVKLRFEVEGARPDIIAPGKGRFWELQGLEAPVNLSADIDYTKAEGLRSAAIDLSVLPGQFMLHRELRSRSFPFERLNVQASLALGDERMDIETLDFRSPKIAFKSSGFMTELGNLSDGDVNSSPIFDLKFRNIRLDLTPSFEAPLDLRQLDLVGQADFDSRRLDISKGHVKLFESTHDFDGSVVLEDNNGLKTVLLNSKMSGVLQPDQFLSLWPVKAFSGARRWIDRSVTGGKITQLDAEIAFEEDFFEDRLLTEDRLKLLFSGTDTSVRFMETMPQVVEVFGGGQLIGNQLSVNLDSGRLDGITLTGGSVEIPRLLPKGGDIVVNAYGQGEASELLRVADFPPFQIASRYNVDPKALAGRGTVSINVVRPLLEFFPREEIEYQIKGDFVNATAPFELGDYKVTNGTLSMDANKERVVMKGPVNIGPWRADVLWQETFGENAPPTQYQASGEINADLLDKLGVGSRTWFDGTAYLKVDAVGRGRDIFGANINLDLTASELSVERVWMKIPGESARLTGQLSREPDGSYIIDNAKITGADLDVAGRVEIEPDYKLREIDLSNVSIASLIEGAVRITPDRRAGRLGVELNANYLDVSPWTEDLFAERQSNLDVPLTLDGRVKTLILDEFYPVSDSEIYFTHTGEVIETARLEAFSDGEPLKLELSTREDLKRELNILIPDASKAVSAFISLDNTSGGKLEITASLPAAGEEGAFVGEVDMRDFKLKEAPALAQLLSLASLKGLADTLSGGSMEFDRFRLPFTMLGDDIAIRDARLYGPALGMTGNGDIDLGLRVLDFDGTLVPAYTANSILGDIPVLGDLFVQEQDGGLFALTYTVSGPFEKTQIAVNPLSALTPGFLRGIFKRDRSKIDDAMKEAIEDIAPKEKTEADEP
jgi:hypothetical protein